ncbi:MAG: hypothetical protein R2939_01370 [Kofleriaceae bacterium]
MSGTPTASRARARSHFGHGRLVTMAMAWLLGAGCVAERDRRCADGTVCPATQACAPAGGGCVDPDRIAACNGLAEGADCELVGIGAGTCRAGVCAVTGCGDGTVDVGEECDDGDAIDDDECTNACTLPVCGDGVRQGAETCDDGAGNGDDRACTASCRINVCGDGLVQLGVEACDAGAANADDGPCTTACTVATCGDGLVWAGVEACDDGNLASGDGCRGDCAKLEACGDGVVDEGEACDDGPAGLANPADGCDACTATAWQAEAVLGRERLATEVSLAQPAGVAVDLAGNVYIADTANHRVRRVAADTGVITTIAGTGVAGSAGDGGPATAASLGDPVAVAVDGRGDVYISEANSHRIRRVVTATGIITTVAGTGVAGFGGDGGAATSARLSQPAGIEVDGTGNLFIADSDNHRIRRVAASTGIITTVAGTGVEGYLGDGGAATSARLARPRGVTIDAAGNLLIADTNNGRVRRVSIGTGAITTVAGDGGFGGGGDGGPATAAQLATPYAVEVAPNGDMYIADTNGARVRRVEVATGIIRTAAGTFGGFGGDGGPATSAQLSTVPGLALDPSGTLYIADAGNHRVRRVAVATQVISTLAGTGVFANGGDGAAATSAQVLFPGGVAVSASGDVFLVELLRVRRVSAATDTIDAAAGTGAYGFGGDGEAAVAARLAYPRGVAVDLAGNVYIADTSNQRVRRVAAATGIITTIAGTGVDGFAGDGGQATAARLRYPAGVTVDLDGNVFIADTDNHRVRRVAAATGVITTVAGVGTSGSAGDGGAAVSAQLTSPSGLAVSSDGDLYIADRGNHRVRCVDGATGIITTVAGTGMVGGSGDGGPAIGATLAGPADVTVAGDGTLYIADSQDHRVRRVDAGTGLIATVAGTGTEGVGGDGGPAVQAELAAPAGVAVDAAGTIYVADMNNSRVRRVDGATGVITTIAGAVDPEGMGPALAATLADPRAVALTADEIFIAGGSSGTLQALAVTSAQVRAIAGRYPQPSAVADLARFRDEAFGTVGGVAYDAALGRVYLAETSANRLHAVTVTDPERPEAWTITTLAGDGVAPPGGSGAFVDGPAAIARFDAPAGLYFDEDARVLYIADAGNHVVRALPIDLAGAAGTVTTVAGTPRTLGFFGDGGAATDALLFQPQAITRCADGDLFIADTSNHRIRRVAAGAGTITTVLGDGVAASSGQGAPAMTFPVDSPRGLACDPFGNLVVTSRTAVRLVVADGDGVVDGSGAVQTIYGAPPRTAYPESVTTCLTGVAVIDAETVQVTDSCTGVLAELWRQPLP